MTANVLNLAVILMPYAQRWFFGDNNGFVRRTIPQMPRGLVFLMGLSTAGTGTLAIGKG